MVPSPTTWNHWNKFQWTAKKLELVKKTFWKPFFLLLTLNNRKCLICWFMQFILMQKNKIWCRLHLTHCTCNLLTTLVIPKQSFKYWEKFSLLLLQCLLYFALCLYKLESRKDKNIFWKITLLEFHVLKKTNELNLNLIQLNDHFPNTIITNTTTSC